MVDNITCGAAVVVAVQRGSTLQADRQVTGLTEETELLTRVEGAEDRAADTTTGLQLLQSLNRVRCCSLLAPGDRKEEEMFRWGSNVAGALTLSVSATVRGELAYNFIIQNRKQNRTRTAQTLQQRDSRLQLS